MNTLLAALAIGALALARAAAADPMETRTFPGPYGVYPAAANPLNTTLTVPFNTTGYAVGGLRIVMDLTSVLAGTHAGEIVVTATPPAGAPFDVTVSTAGEYTTIPGATAVVVLPPTVNPKGTWSFRIWDDQQQGDGSTAESTVGNVQISLESADPPAFFNDLGLLASESAVYPGRRRRRRPLVPLQRPRPQRPRASPFPGHRHQPRHRRRLRPRQLHRPL
jgi:hypothetical protein